MFGFTLWWTRWGRISYVILQRLRNLRIRFIDEIIRMLTTHPRGSMVARDSESTLDFDRHADTALNRTLQGENPDWVYVSESMCGRLAEQGPVAQ